MQMATSIETDNGEMIVKRVSVPIGLEELMEGLTKEVILKKPKDIYVFASEYFANLLNLREKGSLKVSGKRVQSVTKQIPKNNATKHLQTSKSVETVKQLIKQKTLKTDSLTKKPLTTKKIVLGSKDDDDSKKNEKTKTVFDKHKARKNSKDSTDGTRKQENATKQDSKEKITPRIRDRSSSINSNEGSIKSRRSSRSSSSQDRTYSDKSSPKKTTKKDQINKQPKKEKTSSKLEPVTSAEEILSLGKQDDFTLQKIDEKVENKDSELNQKKIGSTEATKNTQCIGCTLTETGAVDTVVPRDENITAGPVDVKIPNENKISSKTDSETENVEVHNELSNDTKTDIIEQNQKKILEESIKDKPNSPDSKTDIIEQNHQKSLEESIEDKPNLSHDTKEEEENKSTGTGMSNEALTDAIKVDTKQLSTEELSLNNSNLNIDSNDDNKQKTDDNNIENFEEMSEGSNTLENIEITDKKSSENVIEENDSQKDVISHITNKQSTDESINSKISADINFLKKEEVFETSNLDLDSVEKKEAKPADSIASDNILIDVSKQEKEKHSKDEPKETNISYSFSANKNEEENSNDNEIRDILINTLNAGQSSKELVKNVETEVEEKNKLTDNEKENSVKFAETVESKDEPDLPTQENNGTDINSKAIDDSELEIVNKEEFQKEEEEEEKNSTVGLQDKVIDINEDDNKNNKALEEKGDNINREEELNSIIEPNKNLSAELNEGANDEIERNKAELEKNDTDTNSDATAGKTNVLSDITKKSEEKDNIDLKIENEELSAQNRIEKNNKENIEIKDVDKNKTESNLTEEQNSKLIKKIVGANNQIENEKFKPKTKIKNIKTKSLSESNLKQREKDVKENKKIKRIKSFDSKQKEDLSKKNSIANISTETAFSRSNFNISNLHQEIIETSELKKVTNFKSSYNPYILRQEIKQAAENFEEKTSKMEKVTREFMAATKIQSLWRSFKIRKEYKGKQIAKENKINSVSEENSSNEEKSESNKEGAPELTEEMVKKENSEKECISKNGFIQLLEDNLLKKENIANNTIEDIDQNVSSNNDATITSETKNKNDSMIEKPETAKQNDNKSYSSKLQEKDDNNVENEDKTNLSGNSETLVDSEIMDKKKYSDEVPPKVVENTDESTSQDKSVDNNEININDTDVTQPLPKSSEISNQTNEINKIDNNEEKNTNLDSKPKPTTDIEEKEEKMTSDRNVETVCSENSAENISSTNVKQVESEVNKKSQLELNSINPETINETNKLIQEEESKKKENQESVDKSLTDIDKNQNLEEAKPKEKAASEVEIDEKNLLNSNEQLYLPDKNDDTTENAEKNQLSNKVIEESLVFKTVSFMENASSSEKIKENNELKESKPVEEQFVVKEISFDKPEDNKLSIADAVLKIQALWRGFKIRKQLKIGQLFGNTVEQEMKKIEALELVKKEKTSKAIVKIQAAWRGYKVRKNKKDVDQRFAELQKPTECDEISSQNKLTDEDIFKAATKIQAGIRGYMVRKKRNTVCKLNSITEEICSEDISPEPDNADKKADLNVQKSLPKSLDLERKTGDKTDVETLKNEPEKTDPTSANKNVIYETTGNEQFKNKPPVFTKADNKKTENEVDVMVSELDSSITNKHSPLDAAVRIDNTIPNDFVNKDEVDLNSYKNHDESSYEDAPTRPVTSSNTTEDNVINVQKKDNQEENNKDDDQKHDVKKSLSNQDSEDSVATVIFNDKERAIKSEKDKNNQNNEKPYESKNDTNILEKNIQNSTSLEDLEQEAGKSKILNDIANSNVEDKKLESADYKNEEIADEILTKIKTTTDDLETPSNHKLIKDEKDSSLDVNELKENMDTQPETKNSENISNNKNNEKVDVPTEIEQPKINKSFLEKEIENSNKQLQELIKSNSKKVEYNEDILNTDKNEVFRNDNTVTTLIKNDNTQNKINLSALQKEVETSSTPLKELIEESYNKEKVLDETETEDREKNEDDKKNKNKHVIHIEIPLRQLSDIKEEESERKSSIDSSEDKTEESKSTENIPQLNSEEECKKSVCNDITSEKNKVNVVIKSEKEDQETATSDEENLHLLEDGDTINLVHSGEFHDTITLPITVTPPSRSSSRLSDSQNIEERQVLSSGLIHSGELHDNVLPLSVQLNDASSAGAKILTSSKSVDSVVNDGQDRAQASNKDASTCETQSDNRTSSEVSMEAEKRNNATMPKKNMEAEAATKIQAGFRGYQVRKQLKNKVSAPGDISNQRRSSRRKNSGRLTDSGRAIHNKVKTSSDIEEKSAVKIQAGVRGFLVRRRQKKLKQGKESS